MLSAQMHNGPGLMEAGTLHKVVQITCARAHHCWRHRRMKSAGMYRSDFTPSPRARLHRRPHLRRHRVPPPAPPRAAHQSRALHGRLGRREVRRRNSSMCWPTVWVQPGSVHFVSRVVPAARVRSSSTWPDDALAARRRVGCQPHTPQVSSKFRKAAQSGQVFTADAGPSAAPVASAASTPRILRDSRGARRRSPRDRGNDRIGSRRSTGREHRTNNSRDQAARPFSGNSVG